MSGFNSKPKEKPEGKAKATPKEVDVAKTCETDAQTTKVRETTRENGDKDRYTGEHTTMTARDTYFLFR